MSASIPRVLVVVPTGNSQDQIAQTLDSILDQQGVELAVRISDDCSTDSTYRILETYATEHPNIELRYNAEPQGQTRNLMKLIYGAPADEYDFIAIALPGDVWLAGKLAAATAHLTANTSRPELYYCGVDFVDVQGRVLGPEFDGYEVCAAHPASLLLVRNWAYAGGMVMNGALAKLLRRRKAFDFGRSCGAWIHAVALYCDGFVYCDLAHCYVERREDEKAPALDAKDGELSERPQIAGDFDAAFAQRCTTMAQVLLREYERAMDTDTAKLVEAVAVRHVSAKARRFLAGRTDVVLPTSPRTSKLRWKILTDAF